MNPKTMKPKKFSKLVDCGPHEFTDTSLLPSAVMRRAYEGIDAHLTDQYWNMLRRITDKQVTFEQVQVHAAVFDHPVTFPDDSRMLVLTDIRTINDRRQLQYEADIHTAQQPFTKIATYRAVANEFQYADPQQALFASPTTDGRLTSEIKDLAPAGEQSEDLRGFNSRLRGLRLAGKWLGPVQTRHVAIADYCQYAQLAVFLCYAGPVTHIGRCAMVDWLRANHSPEVARTLASKIDYRGWKMWLSLIGTFYLNQRFVVHTYFMQIEDKCHLKHEIYTAKPEVLVNIILEQYAV